MSRTDEIRDAIIQARRKIEQEENEASLLMFFFLECGVLSAFIGLQYHSWLLFIISLIIISALFWVPLARLLLGLLFSVFWIYCAYWVCQWFSFSSSTTIWLTVIVGLLTLGFHLTIYNSFTNLW